MYKLELVIAIIEHHAERSGALNYFMLFKNLILDTGKCVRGLYENAEISELKTDLTVTITLNLEFDQLVDL